MQTSTILIIVFFLVIWIYSISSIYSSKFENKEEKIFWRIGIIFVPFLAFFYIFKKILR